MLHRIFSACAQTKVKFFFDQISKRLPSGKRIFFIVPEQVTVSYEAALAAICPPSFNFTLEILNFSRLPNRVFRETGGMSFRPVNKTGKFLILSRALSSLEGELEILDLRTDRPSAVERLEAQIGEFENFGVTPAKLEELAKIAKNGGDGNTAKKLSDLARIFRRYRELMDASFDDACSENRKLLEILNSHDFFKDSLIYIEGFYDFTADQYALMRRMAVQAEEVYVGLFAEKADLEGSGFARRAVNAAKKLALMADRDTMEDLFLTSKETVPTELRHLSENLFSRRQAYAGPCDAVHLTGCRTAYDEVCFAAARIRGLVKEGYRYSQIAVSYRRDLIYPRLCQSVFKRFEIPFHCGVIKSAAQDPPAILMESACRIASGDRRLKTFRKYMKTGLTGLESEESFLLESYALTWDLNGRVWMEEGDLVMPPDGYGSPRPENQSERLREINAARKKLIAPLKSLEEGLRAPTVGEKLRALGDYLNRVGAGAAVEQKAQRLREQGDFSDADNAVALWNALLEALRQLDVTLGEEEVSPKEFCDYLRLSLKSCESGSLPPAPDCVQIGEASFMRSSDVNALFVLGVNARIFPPEDKPAGILSPGERRLFAANSVELSDNAEDSALNEYFLFDQLVRTPSQKLFLTYHEKKSAADPSPCAPSIFAAAVKAIFPGLKEEYFDAESALPTCREEAFRYYSAHFGEDSRITKVLGRYFDEDPRSEALRGAGKFLDSAMDLSAPPYAPGKNLSMTQSRLDRYINCRYEYFADYMLRLQRPPTPFPDVTASGNLTHSILEKFFASLYASGEKPEDWEDEKIKERIEELCRDYFAAYDRAKGADEKKIDYLIARAAESLHYTVRRLLEELEQSDFAPILFEASIPGDVPAYSVPLPDGSRLELYGKIDRVDLYRSPDGTEYVRIIDYKSSQKELNLEEVYNGLKQQMFIYLFALWKGGVRREGKNVPVTPAGILYVPASRPEFTVSKRDPEEIAKEARKKSKKDGLILDSDEIRRAMKTDGSAIFVSRGADSPRYFATLEEFGILAKHTEKQLKRIAAELKGGRIAPDPFASGQDSCKYCPYKAVCKYESHPKKRYRYFDRKEEIFQAMKEENQ